MLETLIDANRRYSERFSLGALPARAARGFALVTCMDSRIEPLTMLGLRPGDAKIMRNAGGRVTPDVLRSLVLATNLLGVDAIAVMQHTGCALAHRHDDDVRTQLRDAGSDAAVGADYLAMPDPDEALRHDVDAVRSCAGLPGGTRVEGWRYDVRTGLVDRVIVAP